MLNPESSWTPTLFLMMGPLLYKVRETLFILGILTSFIFLEIHISLNDIYCHSAFLLSVCCFVSHLFSVAMVTLRLCIL